MRKLDSGYRTSMIPPETTSVIASSTARKYQSVPAPPVSESSLRQWFTAYGSFKQLVCDSIGKLSRLSDAASLRKAEAFDGPMKWNEKGVAPGCDSFNRGGVLFQQQPEAKLLSFSQFSNNFGFAVSCGLFLAFSHINCRFFVLAAGLFAASFAFSTTC